LNVAVGRFGLCYGPFWLYDGPFWTIFLEIKGRFGRGRFGDGPFWYRPQYAIFETYVNSETLQSPLSKPQTGRARQFTWWTKKIHHYV